MIPSAPSPSPRSRVYRKPLRPARAATLSLVARVAVLRGVSLAAVLSRRESPDLEVARQQSAWLLAQCGWSTADIAEAMRRDEDTVAGWLAGFEARMAADPELAARMAAVVGAKEVRS